MEMPVKLFPNGNFAKKIKLPGKKNIVQLVQILNGERRILTRCVIARRCKAPTKQSQKQFYVKTSERLLWSLTLPHNDVTLIIDPGHGGKEHGTHSPKGIPEKYFNLQIAKMVVESCNGMTLQGEYYLTRSIDKFISLKDRVQFAKKKKCNIFISIHHNALPDNEDPLKHKGVGIYYTNDFVKPLAKSILKTISQETGLKQYGVFERNFAVTKPDFYYGILIECGFLIHPLEAEIITKPQMQKKIADAIVKGLSVIIS